MPSTLTPLASLDVADGLVATLVGHDQNLETVEGCVAYLQVHGTLRRGTISIAAAEFVENRLREEGYVWDSIDEADAVDESADPGTAETDQTEQPTDSNSEANDPHDWTDWPVSEMTDDEVLAKFCETNKLETLGALWEYIHTTKRGGSKVRVIAVDAFDRFFKAYPDCTPIDYTVSDSGPAEETKTKPSEQAPSPTGGSTFNYPEKSEPEKVSPLVVKREKALRNIERLNTLSLSQRGNWEYRKAEAAAAKKAYDQTVAELHAAISSAGNPQLDLPGMDDEEHAATAAEQNEKLAEAVAASEQAAPAPESEEWRNVTLESLGFTKGMLKSLEENDPPIKTVGDISDWNEAGRDLTHVKGIGQGKADQAADILEKFWADQGLAQFAAQPDETTAESSETETTEEAPESSEDETNEPIDESPAEEHPPTVDEEDEDGPTGHVRLLMDIPGLDSHHGMTAGSVHEIHAPSEDNDGTILVRTLTGMPMRLDPAEFELVQGESADE